MLQRRPILVFAVAFIAGVLAVRHLPWLYAYVWLAWLAAGIAAAALFFRPPAPPAVPSNLPGEYVRDMFPSPGLIAGRGAGRFMVAIMLALLALGMQRQHGWRERVEQARAALPDKTFFNGVLLANAPMRNYPGEEGEWRISAVLLSADGVPASVPVSLSASPGPDFRRGDLLDARLRIREDYPRTFPGAFDFRQWLERDGLVASLAVVKPRGREGERPPYRVVAMDEVPLATRVRRGVDAVRSRAISMTFEYGGQAMGGMLSAMLYGHRKNMDSSTRDTFRRVGIGHVLAISGLHVGLVVGLLWWASGWFGGTHRARAVACLFLAVFYLGLAGGQVAAMRATVMAIIHLGGIAWGRKSDMLNSLGAAALFLTAANPSAPADVSFQLSFTAVFFIFVAVTGTRAAGDAPEGRAAARRKTVAAKLWRELVALLRVNIATWFGLFPIIMVVFYQVNPVGLLINMPVIPLMSLVLAGGLVLPWLGWIPGVAFVLTLPGELLLLLAKWADRLPYSSFSAHAPGWTWFVLFYAFFVLLLFGRLVRNRRRRLWWSRICRAAIAAVTVGLAVSARSLPPPETGRLALLPGWNLDVAVVEDAKGNIAVIGNPSRDGLREAGWLHSLRRSGTVTVIRTEGDADGAGYPALAYHSGIRRILTLSAQSGDGKLKAGSRRWLPLPEMEGVEISVSRDRSGRIVWLAIRASGGTVCNAGQLTPRQLDLRLREAIPGSDADFLAVGLRRDAELPAAGAGRERQVRAVRRGKERELPFGWINRDLYGAVVVAGGAVKGYDGKEWVVLPGGAGPVAGP